MMHWISLLTLSALLVAGPASGEVYKCRTADGRVEIANSPCASTASTLKTVPDEQVPEANRQQAERDAERMRNYVEKREAAQRADEAAERQRQASQVQAAGSSIAGNGRSVDECLRDLDRQALEVNQRAYMEAACRSNPAQPAYVPVSVPGYGGYGIYGGYGGIGHPRPWPHPPMRPEINPGPPAAPPFAISPPKSKNRPR